METQTHTPRTFPGGAFDADLPDGRAAATLEVGQGIVRATFADCTARVIPLEALRLEFGGATGRMLFLRGDDPALTLFSDTPGLFEAIAAEGGAEAAVATALGGVQKKRRRHGMGWLAVLAVLLALVAVVPPIFRAAVDGVVDHLPLSVDTQLGDLASGEVARLGPAVVDERAAGFATEIVERMRPHLPPEIAALDLKVTVVENGQVNAFALPGGRMAVLSGLLKKATSADMVAGVMAHELMHVRHRHGVRHALRSIGVIAGIQVLFGDASGLAAMFAEGAALAALTSYSREQESQSDTDGLVLMAAAGFDPAGMPAFFRRLKEVMPEAEGPDSLSWLGSHPRLDERISTLEAQIPATVRGPAMPLTHTLEAARQALRDE